MSEDEAFVQPDSSSLGDGVAAVMMRPTAKVQKDLALFGGQSPSDLHVTVQYLGSVSDLPPKEEVVRALQGIVPVGSVSVQVDDPGSFPPGKDGVPVILKVSDGSNTFAGMREAMAAAGLPDASEHDFNPHMTLAYAPDQERADRFISDAEGQFPVARTVLLNSTVLGWDGDDIPIRPSAVARLARRLGE